MVDIKKLELFVNKLEDEIFKRTDIESFDEFMTELTKELCARYITSIAESKTKL
jgi:hypothetical protein